MTQLRSVGFFTGVALGGGGGTSGSDDGKTDKGWGDGDLTEMIEEEKQETEENNAGSEGN